MKVLVVEDEALLRHHLQTRLGESGHIVDAVPDAEEALYQTHEFNHDLAVIDLGLPGISGLDLIRQLRSRGKTFPILILTARGNWQDKVEGLAAGADDYVVKPFSIRELLLRVRAVLRRSVTDSTSSDDRILCFGRLRIDSAAHRVWVDEDEIVLTALEFRLLLTFIDRKDRVQSREQLLDDVWGVHAGITTRTVDVHIKRLRTKLGKAGHYVGTVRGVGYRFSLPTEPAV